MPALAFDYPVQFYQINEREQLHLTELKDAVSLSKMSFLRLLKLTSQGVRTGMACAATINLALFVGVRAGRPGAARSKVLLSHWPVLYPSAYLI